MGWSEQDEQDEHRLLVERIKPRDDRIEELERQLASQGDLQWQVDQWREQNLAILGQWQAEKRRADEAERQLAEARAELDAEGREWLRTKDIDRLQEAEHQLAEMVRTLRTQAAILDAKEEQLAEAQSTSKVVLEGRLIRIGETAGVVAGDRHSVLGVQSEDGKIHEVSIYSGLDILEKLKVAFLEKRMVRLTIEGHEKGRL